MLNKLPLDVFLLIILNFNSVLDIINIILLNKYFYLHIDDTYFRAWGINKYSKKFWIKANRRSTCISKPLSCMRLELLRLQRFIDCMKIQNVVWSNEDFYKFWNMLEEYKENNTIFRKNYLYPSIYT
jgi:hypothetical protein